MTSFCSEEELKALGLKACGRNVLVSRHARLYGASSISLGDNVRIDDFCILSGNITIGSHVHLSAGVKLYGAMGIRLHDHTGISAESTVYSAMDDFSGEYLIGPVHEATQTHVTGGEVVLERFSQVGAHCVVFPRLTIGEGSVVGAMGLVKNSLPPWGIYVGQPARFLKERKKDLLNKL